jgi:hypothetical protein
MMVCHSDVASTGRPPGNESKPLLPSPRTLRYGERGIELAPSGDVADKLSDGGAG